MGVFAELFAWWTGNTIGTRLFTGRFGVKVGEDAQGNRYYRSKKAMPPLGERRWVVFAGEAEASVVPPGWHAWLHHTVDVAPSEEDYRPREWERAHVANLTGTAGAYRPAGSALTLEKRPRTTGDYDAWSPE